jgi:hypothetical protein
MKKEEIKKPPFREDHLDDYKKLSAEQILTWLEEANRFFRKFMPPEKRMLWREFKQKRA